MNPFDLQLDPDRHAIWQRLVAVDCEAFAAGDWSLIADDFDADAFEGIRCFHSQNPDDWRILFADLASYRESWLAASETFRALQFTGCSHLKALLARCHLDEIEIVGDRALAHKKFFGNVPLGDGGALADRRQTLYRLHKQNGMWKIGRVFRPIAFGRARLSSFPAAGTLAVEPWTNTRLSTPSTTACSLHTSG